MLGAWWLWWDCVLCNKSPGLILIIKMTVRAWISNSWWRHQIETFSALLAICAGNSPVPVNSPHKGQWRGALMFTLICVWINGWVNNGEAGDLRRHRVHYDAIVMYIHMYIHKTMRYNLFISQLQRHSFKPLLNLGHRWVITCHMKRCI